MSALIQINIRKEDGTYINYMGSISDYFDLNGKPITIGNLVVAQNDFPNKMNWNDAIKACAALGKGWRLPNKDEFTIIDLGNNALRFGLWNNPVDWQHIFRSPEYYLEKQYPLKIVHTPNQDKTDLEKAFDYLIEEGHKAVNVVWATGKRADHTINNLTNIANYRDKLKIVIIDDHSKVFLLPRKFEKWYTEKTPISLIPVGKVTGIHSTNLHYPLKEDTLTMGYRTGSSNFVTKDGIVVIEHETGDLLLMECLD